MAGYPPKKGSGRTVYVSLPSQADPNIFQANPTIAAGDFKCAVDDAAPANLTTLPVVDADFTKRVKVVLSDAEIAGDTTTIIASDQAGDEWCDVSVEIDTSVRQIDDLTFPAVSGRSLAIDASGYITVGALAAAVTTALVAAVWAAGTRTLTSFGTLLADIWAYASRTLTQTAAQVQAALSGSVITIRRGDTLTVTLTGLGVITGYTSLDWTVKRSRDASDNDAVIHIRKNASGSGDGLLRINGAAATTAANGSIAITDATAGDITISLDEVETAKLGAVSNLVWDVQKNTATTVLTLTDSTANVVGDVTRATS